jgi:hypothetical protein
MSLYDYRTSLKLEATECSFYALIMAAMRKADTDNLIKLKMAFPEVYDELSKRYYAPQGVLHGEQDR